MFKVFSLSWFQSPYFEVPLCGFLSIYPACGSKDLLNLLLDFFQLHSVPQGECAVSTAHITIVDYLHHLWLSPTLVGTAGVT